MRLFVLFLVFLGHNGPPLFPQNPRKITKSFLKNPLQNYKPIISEQLLTYD